MLVCQWLAIAIPFEPGGLTITNQLGHAATKAGGCMGTCWCFMMFHHSSHCSHRCMSICYRFYLHETLRWFQWIYMNLHEFTWIYTNHEPLSHLPVKIRSTWASSAAWTTARDSPRVRAVSVRRVSHSFPRVSKVLLPRGVAGLTKLQYAVMDWAMFIKYSWALCATDGATLGPIPERFDDTKRLGSSGASLRIRAKLCISRRVTKGPSDSAGVCRNSWHNKSAALTGGFWLCASKQVETKAKKGPL